MDLSLSPEDLAFREEVCGFLNENLPDDIAAKIKGNRSLSRDETVAWGRTLNRQGWGAPSWPKEAGGTGWSLLQRHIFDMECRRVHAPPIHGFNISMLGPAIVRFGSDEQKSELLPRALNMDDLWCQGYSEPNAGSDLASLQSRAERDGDEYVVNGSKIWTSAAEVANKIFCLVRTSTNAKPQEGISFLLIDMDTPGVKVEPLIALNGVRLWNQVFFDDVRVPAQNRLGAENEGWTVAKRLLEDERIMVSRVAENHRLLGLLKAAASEEQKDGERLSNDTGFAQKISALEVRLTALENLSLRLLSAADGGARLGAEPSMLKLLGSELVQAIDTATIEAIAYFGAPDYRTMLGKEGGNFSVGPAHASMVMSGYLHHRGFTIAGGSSEVQHNIIAKQLLGL